MKFLSECQREWVPVTLLITAGALFRVADGATDSLAILISVRIITVLALALGWMSVRRTGALLTTTLWAIMAVNAAVDLSGTLILAIPESDVITAERQASRAAAIINILSYTLVIMLAVRVGARSVRAAGLVIVASAAVFAPTWPFLSPGIDEFGYFVARGLLMATAVGIVVLVAFGFRYFSEWSPQRQARVVAGLIILTVARIVIAASPGAAIAPLATIDSMFFGVVGYGAVNALAMGVAWIAIRARSPGAS